MLAAEGDNARRDRRRHGEDRLPWRV